MLGLKTEKQQQGDRAEALAERFLKSQGLQWRERKFRCPLGEIDLIFQDKDCLVFVEVRFRTHNDFGGALESITKFKQKKIIRTAQVYLARKRAHHMACRFDVILLGPTLTTDHIQWLSNAFSVDSNW